MTNQPPLPQHLQVCDELYQLAHEENRHLKERHCPPGSELLERKRALLGRLDESLTALRSSNPASADQRQLAEKIRSRILQILQLDKENEQLLLRTSLSRGLGSVPAPSAPAAGMLRKIYARL